MIRLYAGIAIAALLAGAIFGLIEYGRSLERVDNLQATQDAQLALFNLGNVIQKQEAEKAEAVRDKQLAVQGRIDAINTNGHKTQQITLLQRKLDEVVRQQSAVPEASGDTETVGTNRYIVCDAADIERVWNEAVCDGECTTQEPTGTIQTQLP